ncbi:hypothetical protein GPECTOR_16g588 [Gonium pectorale]|uniref:Uncharacterized protein n=1 Tax=Gonium pectorale TaxID=33097 RepID=A0A150GKU7_GONPE|nr:hypothetical protein GPECTOR_16g588 [Gonium pectorale]|eukprot:KXZ50414.1 hypothetical protein GPECTOR_16g588 [Gonium pectorale]
MWGINTVDLTPADLRLTPSLHPVEWYRWNRFRRDLQIASSVGVELVHLTSCGKLFWWELHPGASGIDFRIRRRLGDEHIEMRLNAPATYGALQAWMQSQGLADDQEPCRGPEADLGRGDEGWLTPQEHLLWGVLRAGSNIEHVGALRRLLTHFTWRYWQAVNAVIVEPPPDAPVPAGARPARYLLHRI